MSMQLTNVVPPLDLVLDAHLQHRLVIQARSIAHGLSSAVTSHWNEANGKLTAFADDGSLGHAQFSRMCFSISGDMLTIFTSSSPKFQNY